MASIGWALAILVVGGFLGTLYAIVVGLGGVPGALVAKLGENGRSRSLFRAGLVLCALGQAYFVLLFAALVFSFAREIVVSWGLSSWLVMAGAFLAVGSPVTAITRDSRHAIQKGEGNVQHLAAGFVSPVVLVGTIAMLFSPVVNTPWAWFPGVAAERPAVGSAAEPPPVSAADDALPKQPDRWMKSVVLDADSTAKYIGKTKQVVMTDLTQMKDLDGVRVISVGDEVAGLRIGAIKCSFHWRDASYGGKKYMWRGQWACMAGKSKTEIEAAVSEDGQKRFDYIHLAPVRLPSD